MEHGLRKLTGTIVLAFLFSLSATASAEALAKKKSAAAQEEVTRPPDSMTIWQARRTVVTALKKVMPKNEFTWGAGYKVNMRPESIQLDAARVECTADVSTWGFNTKPDPHAESCDVDLKTIGVIGIKSYRRQYNLTQEGRRDFGDSLLGNIAWDTAEEAQAFADAMNRLRTAARGEDLDADQAAVFEFRRKAAAWRALPSKPAISEQVRRHRLLAENAVQEKRFDAAVEEYEAGLESDPAWPEGHFNAALLSAELGYYSLAMWHMRCYLELVPEASDAQSARDQMVIWEAKIRADSGSRRSSSDMDSARGRKPARR